MTRGTHDEKGSPLPREDESGFHPIEPPPIHLPLAVALTALGFTLTHALFYAAGAALAQRSGLPRSAGLEIAHAAPLVHGLALSFGLGLATLAHALRDRSHTSALELLGLTPVPARALPLAALVGVGAHVAGAELMNCLRELRPLPLAAQLAQQRLVEPTTWGEGVSAVVAFVALAPLSEEVFFRGTLFPGLTRAYGRPLFALVLSAALFGAFHLEPMLALYAGLMGALLAALTLHARSILPALVAHAAHNALPLLLPSRVLRIEGLNAVGDANYHLHPVLWTMAVLTTVLGARELLATLTQDP